MNKEVQMLGLKWTAEKQQRLMSVIQYNRRQAKFGISCVYFALSKNIGVKLYSTQKERDKTHEKQAHAAKYKLAPAAGECFSFQCFWIGHNPCSAPDVRYKVIYGYLTQNATMPPKRDRTDLYPLELRLRQIGLVNDDLCNYNVGYIGKRLVCIDFDNCSCHWMVGRKKGKDAQRT